MSMNTVNPLPPSVISEETHPMLHPIRSVADLGALLRVRRKARKLRLHDAAALAGCSVQFLHDLEAGKTTIRMGLALDYASKFGVTLLTPVEQQQSVPEKVKRGREKRRE